jgi:Protein of unknown function (DUF3015)
MNISASLRLLGMMGLTIAVSSCAVTVDSLKASSETIHNTTDASSDFTSSTSPREARTPNQGAQAFTSYNFARLREDMAVGGGEHLASLAALLNIPDSDRPAFFRFTKERFSAWFNSEQATPDEVLAKLTAELADHPERLQ